MNTKEKQAIKDGWCPNCEPGKFTPMVDGCEGCESKPLPYTSSDLHKQVNENETLLQFIRNSEKEFGMNVACLGSMGDKEFNEYIDWLDELWGK